MSKWFKMCVNVFTVLMQETNLCGQASRSPDSVSEVFSPLTEFVQKIPVYGSSKAL